MRIFYPKMDRFAPSIFGLHVYPKTVSYLQMDRQLTRYQALVACRDAAGSDSQMARDLSVPQSTMWRWINQSKQLPALYVLKAEALYGVSRHDLRPDIYPREQPDARKRAGRRSAAA